MVPRDTRSFPTIFGCDTPEPFTLGQRHALLNVLIWRETTGSYYSNILPTLMFGLLTEPTRITVFTPISGLWSFASTDLQLIPNQ